MSIDIYGFLGSDFDDLEARVVRAFKAIGFSVEIHPDMRLLESNSSGCLYLSFTETPSQVTRVQADLPLLLGFGYVVTKRTSGSPGWPPKGVNKFRYEVCTRTSAGRSYADYFAQALIVAILAKETNGFYYVNGDDAAVPGDRGLENVLGELARATGNEFDAGAYPFNGWPPLDPNVPFEWTKPVASLQRTLEVADQVSKKATSSFSVTRMLVWSFVLLFVVTLLVNCVKTIAQK